MSAETRIRVNALGSLNRFHSGFIGFYQLHEAGTLLLMFIIILQAAAYYQARLLLLLLLGLLLLLLGLL